MEINFNTEPLGFARPPQVAPKPAVPPAAETSGSFQQSQALEAQLGQLPDTRADQVDRGRALVSLEQYPPIEMMRKITRLFTSSEDDSSADSQAQ